MIHRMRSMSALLLLAVLAACGKPASPPARPPAPVRTVTVGTSDVTIARDYPGIAVSVRTVEIEARVEGWILRQVYKDGQVVQAGDTLYQIDPDPFRIALERERASLAAAEAAQFNAKQKFDRNQPLVATGAISQEDFDQLDADLRSADAKVLEAKAAVDQAQLRLSYCTVQTPVTGQASRTRIYEGTLVKPMTGGLLTDVRQLDPIWVEFSPVASDIPALRALAAKGTGLAVRDPSGSWRGAGRVVFVDNAVQRSTGTIVARVEVPNPGLEVMPGQYLQVDLPQRSLQAVPTIPEQAIVYQTAAATVWVVQPDGTAKPIVVQVGPKGGAGVVVTEGLKGGEKIVVEGQGRLQPGEKVAEAPPA
jgi:membrane fusion protein (multidrug efflux system)